MLTVGIVDDSVGMFPTLSKLRQVVSADYICLMLDTLSKANSQQLYSAGSSAYNKLVEMGCDAVVLSSVALSARCFKQLAANNTSMAVFGCDAPVLHASTYTVSGVLVVGDSYVVRAQNLPNVITCAMPLFSELAAIGNERDIVKYISDCCEKHYGKFDCIALASSSMNMYKHCFSRVFPNVQIFDSLEGVARRIRKKYKKLPKEDSTYKIIDINGTEIVEKYTFFLE